MTIKNLSVPGILLFIFLYSSCNTDSLESLQSLEDEKSDFAFNESKTIRSNGVFMEFLSYEDFKASRNFNLLSNSTNFSIPSQTGFVLKHPKEIAEELNFRSLRHLFEEIQESQKQHLQNILKNYDDLDQFKLENNEPIFSELVFKYQHLLNIDESTGMISLKFYDPEFAYLLNEDGIVAAAGMVYQYTDKYIKSTRLTPDVDLTLLINSNSSDKNKDIIVNEVKVVSGSRSVASGREAGCSVPLTGSRLFIVGRIEQIDYTEEVNNCYSDESCFATGQFICCYEPTIVYGSHLYVQNKSYTSCGGPIIFNYCFGGDELYNIDEIGVSGSFAYTAITGVSANSTFQENKFNTCELKRTLYFGDRLSSSNATVTFTGNYLLSGLSNLSASCVSNF